MEMICCDPSGIFCCSCKQSCSPGSDGGTIKSKELNAHFYCYDCYPKFVDLYIAEEKLKQFNKEKNGGHDAEISAPKAR